LVKKKIKQTKETIVQNKTSEKKEDRTMNSQLYIICIGILISKVFIFSINCKYEVNLLFLWKLS